MNALPPTVRNARKLFKQVAWILSLMFAFVVLFSESVNSYFDVHIPPDGNGVRWSTLKKVVAKIPLANGDTVEVHVSTRPWGDHVIAFKYEARLERTVTVGGRTDSTIQVWVVPEQAPENAPDGIKRAWKRFQYWCHGWTFDDSTYSPMGNEVPKILAAGWTEVECQEPQPRGEIIIYYDASGNVAHSAVSNGDGTYQSKEGQTARFDRRTKAEMDGVYPGTTTKCYRRRQ